MIRYLPANGTAGLARRADKIERRSPSPPASTTASTRFTRRCYTPLLSGREGDWGGGGSRAAHRHRPVLRPGRLHLAVRGARRGRRGDHPGRLLRDGARDGGTVRGTPREVH